jgi:hypothetical protein
MKCLYQGCKAKAIGGIRELIDASSQDFPDATIEGDCIAWCEKHEDDMLEHSPNKWRKLTALELRGDSC